MQPPGDPGPPGATTPRQPPAVKAIDLGNETFLQEGLFYAERHALGRARERTRGYFALAVAAILVLLAATACAAMLRALWTNANVADAREFSITVIGLVMGVVGAVAGFYFGRHTRDAE